MVHHTDSSFCLSLDISRCSHEMLLCGLHVNARIAAREDSRLVDQRCSHRRSYGHFCSSGVGAYCRIRIVSPI